MDLQEECTAQLQYTGTTFSQEKEQRTHRKQTPMPETQPQLPPTDSDMNTHKRHLNKHIEGNINLHACIRIYRERQRETWRGW